MILAGRQYILYRSKADEIIIRVFGDGHFGARGSRVDKWKRDIAEVEDDPRMYWLELGDWGDLINPRDRRFDPKHVDPDIPIAVYGEYGSYVREQVQGQYQPVQEKGVGAAYGNHEWYYMNQTDQSNLHAALCENLHIPNLSYCFMLDLVFIKVGNNAVPYNRVYHDERPVNDSHASWSVRVWGHHGMSGARTPGGKVKNLIDAMHRWPSADLVILGHGHSQVIAPPMISIDGDAACRKQVTHTRLGAMTGSYLEAYPISDHPSYGERAGYEPNYLGPLDIHFKPWERVKWIPMVARDDR